MKKNIAFVITLLSLHVAHAQSIDKIINATEVKRIEQILSADDMQGRRTFTPGIEKASAFIESEFKKTGLQTFNGATNYRQDFFMYQANTESASITIDGKNIDDSLVAIFSYQTEVLLTEKNDVEIVTINAGESFGQKFYQSYQSKKICWYW